MVQTHPPPHTIMIINIFIGVYNMENTIGNTTTIIKFISMTLAGWIIAGLTAHNLNLGIDAVTLANVIGALIGLILSYIDARYPNTFGWLDNQIDNTVIDTEEPVLNDEYESDL